MAEVKFSWVHQHNGIVNYAHMAMLEQFATSSGETIIACAFQASQANTEGSEIQHIRFSTSVDNGETWAPSRCVMWGLQALWSPVLHFHHDSSSLYLFYSESRKARSPGGDIKYIKSFDYGQTWTPPVTILTHEYDGEVPKVIANRLLVLNSGSPTERWVLPFWSEPFNSFLEYPAYHPLKESPPAPEREPPPGTLVPQGKRGSAGVLILDDPSSPTEWRVAGGIHEPSTWLIENTLEQLSDGRLLMLFRSGTGRIWQSVSSSLGDTWSAPTETSLPNPNSKFSMCRVDMTLVVCYNHSTEKRAPLDIAVSTDDGASWQHSRMVEEDPNGHFGYPTVIHLGGGELAAAYSFWGKGIRLARFSLAE